MDRDMDRKRVFDKLAAHGVCGLQPYVPGKPNDELEREYGITDALKLASNENPLGPPPAVLEALRGELDAVASYPDGSGYHLKQALSRKLGVAPEAITLGNGSNDVLVLLAETFLEPGVEAIYDQYSFVIYRLVVQAADAVARVAPSLPADTPPRDGLALGHDLDAFRSLLSDRTRMIFIANPNNPTGTWLAGDALYAFLETVPEQTIVVLDEAYGEYVMRDDYADTRAWLEDFPNLVLTRTFSKIYALAGLRIGYALSHPDLAELLNRVRQPFNVNHLAQVAARAALEADAFVVRARRMNADGLEYLTRALTGLGYSVTPSIGNFVLVDVGEPAGGLYTALLRAGIIVRPVANYGLPNHLRITVGLPEQNARLVATLEGMRSSRVGSEARSP